MADHHQLVVSIPSSERGLGKSSSADLLTAYPAGPSSTRGDEDVKNFFVDTVLAQGTGGIVNDGGHTFGDVHIDYSKAPDINNVVLGGDGLPGNAHAPNIMSPGEGVDPATIPDGSDVTLRAKGQGGAFHEYTGGTNPSETSANITPKTIGSLIAHGHTA